MPDKKTLLGLYWCNNQLLYFLAFFQHYKLDFIVVAIAYQALDIIIIMYWLQLPSFKHLIYYNHFSIS